MSWWILNSSWIAYSANCFKPFVNCETEFRKLSCNDALAFDNKKSSVNSFSVMKFLIFSRFSLTIGMSFGLSSGQEFIPDAAAIKPTVNLFTKSNSWPCFKTLIFSLIITL